MVDKDNNKDNAAKRCISGPAYVECTLKRYEANKEGDSKMFLLWRALEKQYDVKFRPPSSILDDKDNAAYEKGAAPPASSKRSGRSSGSKRGGGGDSDEM